MQLLQIVLLKKLKKYGKHLTRQQYRTIKGQILSGDTEGASKGLNKLINQEKKGGETNGREEKHGDRAFPVGTTTG